MRYIIIKLLLFALHGGSIAQMTFETSDYCPVEEHYALTVRIDPVYFDLIGSRTDVYVEAVGGDGGDYAEVDPITWTARLDKVPYGEVVVGFEYSSDGLCVHEQNFSHLYPMFSETLSEEFQIQMGFRQNNEYAPCGDYTAFPKETFGFEVGNPKIYAVSDHGGLYGYGEFQVFSDELTLALRDFNTEDAAYMLHYERDCIRQAVPFHIPCTAAGKVGLDWVTNPTSCGASDRVIRIRSISHCGTGGVSRYELRDLSEMVVSP